MNTTYQGDFQNGELRPFNVSAVTGISDSALHTLYETPGIYLSRHDKTKGFDKLPPDIQGLLIRGEHVKQELFQSRQKLMQLIRVGVGTNNINMSDASHNGIATLNTPGGSTKAVAKHALSMMLAWSNRIIQ